LFGCGGATPPVSSSGPPPPELPLPPPVPLDPVPVPPLGAWPVEGVPVLPDGACGADWPPELLDPLDDEPPEDPLVESSFLPFVLPSVEVDGSPEVIGAGVEGALVVLDPELVSPPPPDAIATITTKNSTTTPIATSLRRR
jgi:hypothetical protein